MGPKREVWNSVCSSGVDMVEVLIDNTWAMHQLFHLCRIWCIRIYLCSCESAVGTKLVEYERIKKPHVTSGRHLLHSTKLSFFLGSHNGRCVTYLHHQAGVSGTLQKKRKIDSNPQHGLELHFGTLEGV